MIQIDLHGDSTQYGTTFIAGQPSRVSRPPAVVLQELMDAKFGAGAVLVNNKAIGGTTIANCFHGEAPYTQTWEQAMSASQASIVVVNHGINDSYMAWMRPQDYMFCVNSMATSAVNHGKKFFIETPNFMNNNHDPQLLSFITALYPANSLVSTASIIDQYRLLKNDFTYWAGHLPDGIHPDQALYEKKGQLLFYAIEGTIRRILGQ